MYKGTYSVAVVFISTTASTLSATILYVSITPIGSLNLSNLETCNNIGLSRSILNFSVTLSFSFWVKTLFLCILCILLVTGTSAGAHWYFIHVREAAVVTADESVVRAGPGESYSEIFILHDGAEMRVVQRKDDWVKVQIQIESDIKRGWIQQKDIEII